MIPPPPAEYTPAIADLLDLSTDVVRRERVLRVRDALLEESVRAPTAEALLRHVLDELCAELDWQYGAIYFTDAPPFLRLISAHGADVAWPSHVSLTDAFHWPLNVAHGSANATLISNLAQHTDAPPWLAGFTTAVNVSLRSLNSVVGVICLLSPQERAVDGEDLRLLSTVGMSMGMAAGLFRLRETAEAALQERNERWYALHAVSTLLTRQSDDGRFLEEVVRSGVRLLHAHGGGLALQDEQTRELRVQVICAGGRLHPEMAGVILPLENSLGGRVLCSGQPLIVNDYSAWEGRVPAFADLGFTAVLGVPLFVDGRPAGVFAINGGSRPFSEDDVQTLMLLAQQASAALERMRARRHLMALTLHEERTRLASELHDGLAQDLASLLLRTDLCLQMASDAPEEVRGALEGIGQGLQRCIRDARATIFALRKADADPADLEDGVRAQVARFESRTHLPVSVQVTGCPTVPAPRSHLLVLLSALQEALRNVERHARASQVLIRIGYDRDAAIRVSVQDDGVGFDPAFLAAPCTGSLHFGLADHLERLAGLGGVLHVRSAPGKGATIEAVLPVHAS